MRNEEVLETVYQTSLLCLVKSCKLKYLGHMSVHSCLSWNRQCWDQWGRQVWARGLNPSNGSLSPHHEICWSRIRR